jgi:hypothetical protein
MNRAETTSLDGLTMTRPNLLPVFRGTAILLAVLVLVQALLAGRGWFHDYGLIETHGIIGNVTFLVAVATAVLAYMVGVPGGLGKQLIGLSGVLVVLVIIQTGLGYGGRTNAEAASWHIPNGVLIFGLTSALLMLVLQVRSSDKAES